MNINRLILLMLPLLFSNCGLKHKPEIDTIPYPEGERECHGKVEIIDGIESKVGNWTCYYANEQKWKCVKYSNGKEYLMEYWSASGEILVSEGEGQVEEIEPNDSIRLVYSVLNGLKDGDLIRYYSNGNILSKHQLVKGLEQGRAFANYPNGNLKWESFFVDGVINGRSREWNINGNLFSESNYSMGKPDGLFLMLDDEQDTICFEQYKMGELIESTCPF